MLLEDCARNLRSCRRPADIETGWNTHDGAVTAGLDAIDDEPLGMVITAFGFLGNARVAATEIQRRLVAQEIERHGRKHASPVRLLGGTLGTKRAPPVGAIGIRPGIQLVILEVHTRHPLDRSTRLGRKPQLGAPLVEVLAARARVGRERTAARVVRRVVEPVLAVRGLRLDLDTVRERVVQIEYRVPRG